MATYTYIYKRALMLHAFAASSIHVGQSKSVPHPTYILIYIYKFNISASLVYTLHLYAPTFCIVHTHFVSFFFFLK